IDLDELREALLTHALVACEISEGLALRERQGECLRALLEPARIQARHVLQQEAQRGMLDHTTPPECRMVKLIISIGMITSAYYLNLILPFRTAVPGRLAPRAVAQNIHRACPVQAQDEP